MEESLKFLPERSTLKFLYCLGYTLLKLESLEESGVVPRIAAYLPFPEDDPQAKWFSEMRKSFLVSDPNCRVDVRMRSFVNLVDTCLLKMNILQQQLFMEEIQAIVRCYQLPGSTQQKESPMNTNLRGAFSMERVPASLPGQEHITRFYCRTMTDPGGVLYHFNPKTMSYERTETGPPACPRRQTGNQKNDSNRPLLIHNPTMLSKDHSSNPLKKSEPVCSSKTEMSSLPSQGQAKHFSNNGDGKIVVNCTHIGPRCMYPPPVQGELFYITYDENGKIKLGDPVDVSKVVVRHVYCNDIPQQKLPDNERQLFSNYSLPKPQNIRKFEEARQLGDRSRTIYFYKNGQMIGCRESNLPPSQQLCPRHVYLRTTNESPEMNSKIGCSLERVRVLHRPSSGQELNDGSKLETTVFYGNDGKVVRSREIGSMLSDRQHLSQFDFNTLAHSNMSKKPELDPSESVHPRSGIVNIKKPNVFCSLYIPSKLPTSSRLKKVVQTQGCFHQKNLRWVTPTVPTEKSLKPLSSTSQLQRNLENNLKLESDGIAGSSSITPSTSNQQVCDNEVVVVPAENGGDEESEHTKIIREMIKKFFHRED